MSDVMLRSYIVGVLFQVDEADMSFSKDALRKRIKRRFKKAFKEAGLDFDNVRVTEIKLWTGLKDNPITRFWTDFSFVVEIVGIKNIEVLEIEDLDLEKDKSEVFVRLYRSGVISNSMLRSALLGSEKAESKVYLNLDIRKISVEVISV